MPKITRINMVRFKVGRRVRISRIGQIIDTLVDFSFPNHPLGKGPLYNARMGIKGNLRI